MWDGVGMEKIPWGRDGDGENFMDWGKFYGDGAGMGTILFTVSLSSGGTMSPPINIVAPLMPF